MKNQNQSTNTQLTIRPLQELRERLTPRARSAATPSQEADSASGLTSASGFMSA